MLERRIQPELLDGLPGQDPGAIRSRRDLRRINSWMGNARLTAAWLTGPASLSPPRHIVDLGAGDGSSLLRWLRRLPRLPRGIEVILVDRREAADAVVVRELGARGFVPRVEQAEVGEWLRARPAESGTWMVANLFLHHFSVETLRAMLGEVAGKAELFCACEPRRAAWPLAASRFLWIAFANAITRHDAVASVHAGFKARELSALWPMGAGWRLREHRAGWFSHLFMAQRS